jgi:hypothetical protein
MRLLTTFFHLAPQESLMANTTNPQRLAAVLPFSDATLLTSLASIADADVVTEPSAASAATVAGENSLLAVAADTTLSISPISIDNSIGYYEHGNATVISGYVNAGNPGDTVTVTLHGKSYSGTLGNDAVWYVSVPESDIAQIPNGKVAISASYTDSAGVLHQTGSQLSLLAGTQTASVPVLYLNKVTGDDVLSAIERGGDLLVSGWGRNIGEGYEVTVTLNGHQYHATTTKDSRWVITIPQADVQALPDGNITLLASLGHETRVAEVAKTLILNNDGAGRATPTLSIDTVSVDDTISHYEIGATTFITGRASDIPAGSRVKLTIGDKVFYGDVTSDGIWSVKVGQLYNAKNADTTHAVVSWKDSAGNETAASREIHLEPSSYPYKYPMAFQIDTISVDGRVDGQEAQNDLIISGSNFSGENLGFGETVYVTLNGKTYTGVVEGGDYNNHWQITVPAGDVQALPPGSYTVIASINATLNTGQQVNSTQTKVVTVIDPDLAFNPISGNNAVSSGEHGNATIISGYAYQGMLGDTVLVTLNGKTYSGKLGSDSMWYVSVPESDIGAIPDGKVNVIAEHIDTSGVAHQVNTQFMLANSSSRLPSLFMNKVTGDDVLSAIERGGDLLVSGWGRFIGPGYEVQVTLNGHTYSTKTTSESRWVLTIPKEDVQALPNGGHVTLLASLVSQQGVNQVAKTLTISHGGEGRETPVLTMDPVFGDDVVNSYEIAADQYVTGQVDHIAAGSTVKLTVGDKVFGGKVTSDGLWSVFTSGLYNLDNGDTTHATISFQDAAGNQFATTRQIELQGRGYPYHYPMTFTLDAISGDSQLSGAEKHQNLIISSSRSSGEGLGVGGTVEVLLNGKIYTTVAEAGPNGDGFDNHWQVTIPTGDVEALAPGSYTVIVTLTDNVSSNGNGEVVRNVQAKIITVDDDGVATLSDSHAAAAQESTVHALAAETATGSAQAIESHAAHDSITPEAQHTALDAAALGLSSSEQPSVSALIVHLTASATQQSAEADELSAAVGSSDSATQQSAGVDVLSAAVGSPASATQQGAEADVLSAAVGSPHGATALSEVTNSDAHDVARSAGPADVSLPAAPADMWQTLSAGSLAETPHADVVYPAATETTLADALQQQHLQPMV